MRFSLRGRPLLVSLLVSVVVAAGLFAVAGCSSGGHNGNAAKPTAASSARPSGAPGPLPPGAIGISATGVTTRVDVPAESTEEEYFQACHAARVWMDAQPNTGSSLIEPYLAMLQASPSGEAGSWNVRWTDLGLARQAAVITAAQAAANAGCG
ncbi:MAG: lipoprotein LpqV [Mycobacterium sp.]